MTIEVYIDMKITGFSPPSHIQDCELPSCHPPPPAPEARRSTHHAPRTQWRFGSWTPVRNRMEEVGRVEGEEDVLWNDNRKWTTVQLATVPNNISTLFHSNTQCSATCGKGTRMRYVSCRDEDGSVADESACTTQPRPVEKEECSVTPCGQWTALDWSPVSKRILWNWERIGPQ